MTTTVTSTTALTSADLTALRTADQIVFRGGATMVVEAIVESCFTGERIYTATEQRLFPLASEWDRRRVLTVGGGVSSTDSDSPYRHDHATGFSMISSAQYSPPWCTIAGLLKVGDELSLDFRADSFTNGYVRDAGLHADVLRLQVQRGARRLTFLVDVSICPDNSARMVK